jgi:hypothetical protein
MREKRPTLFGETTSWLRACPVYREIVRPGPEMEGYLNVVAKIIIAIMWLACAAAIIISVLLGYRGGL